MKFILGIKSIMTQVFKDDGAVVPVTKIVAHPCIVTQVKTAEKDGVFSVQIGAGEKKEKNTSKALKGHLKGLKMVKILRDFRIEKGEQFSKGDVLTVGSFKEGDFVAVSGVSKGKGFQGTVKRHHFRGGPATHGQKHNERMPGSIGGGGRAGGRVVPGMRMAGHMGGNRVTVKNLEVIGVDAEKNEILLKGAVPGAAGSLVEIVGQGRMEITKAEAQTANQ